MKKIISICAILMLLTGCGKTTKKDILKDINKKINSMDSYYLEGDMEIINNEDVYKYDIKVSYKAKDFYKVSLENESNGHEQIILKNNEGVFVLTPSLNKSFKFESEWPYSNSQVYLLGSILKDMKNDKSLEFKEENGSYVFTSKVNYPNNRILIKQNIYFDKSLNLEKVDVLNENGNAEIKMIFKKIDTNPKFNDEYFSLNKNIEVSKIDESIKSVTKIDDAVFPMYLPDNTTLKSKDTIAKNDGERIILTFAGDKPFVLVEETISIPDEVEIIPTVGEPTMLMDTIGFLSEDSVSWISNGMQYYITSKKLSEEEMLSVAKSISTIPVMK
ncbi:MAG: outer membrane lipoprotein carrier protein LolA [Bacilli bacterium]|nr:outer membrane lipoprotein carrier protein LolA [Bacilli bacterium]